MKNHNYIKQQLGSGIDYINIEYFPTIGSTNDYLLEKEFISKYHFCYADIQTKARGRRGSKWIANDQDNVYASLGFVCDYNITESKLISVKVALGVFATIRKFLPEELQKNLKIKLPNDIYYNDQKIAGILIETKNIKRDSFGVVIGIGINVNMQDIIESIDREWTSLAIVNNQQLNSSEVIVALVKNVIKYFTISDESAMVNFKKYDYILNKQIQFNYAEKSFSGFAKGVSHDLKLMIEKDNEITEFELANVNKIRVVE